MTLSAFDPQTESGSDEDEDEDEDEERPRNARIIDKTKHNNRTTLAMSDHQVELGINSIRDLRPNVISLKGDPMNQKRGLIPPRLPLPITEVRWFAFWWTFDPAHGIRLLRLGNLDCHLLLGLPFLSVE